ncbi:hypothetical protein O181_001011 [Austropuccinia psidii MF-1]|uniref:Uncharacterized protein n=1 Tax=Austropuccinia psidii MF-1 TaxID=1389203 RepID=A0A9Q3B9J5_9BASI|nr:hypothetical protein [Austropuccinia psidii MF-1]
MERQENSEPASKSISIIPASTVNSEHNSTVIITQNIQAEPISSELINLEISNTLQRANSLASRASYDSQEAPKTFIDVIMVEANWLQKAKGHQSEGIQQCASAQRVSNTRRPLEKLHELLPECEKITGPSQYLKVTEWMEFIDGKEEHDAFNRRKGEKQPSTNQTGAKTSPGGQKQQLQLEKAATKSEQGQGQSTSHKTIQPRLQNPKYLKGCHGKCVSDGQNHDGDSEERGSHIRLSERISEILDGIPALYIAINDVKGNISDKTSTICNNLKTNSLSLHQIKETVMCFEKGLRAIKTSNNDNSFAIKISKKSVIIQELTDEYSKVNIDYIIETIINKAISIITGDNQNILVDITNSSTEVKRNTIALKKCFDTSQEDISKVTMKLNQIISNNTRQKELWKEMSIKEEIYKIELINLIQVFHHEVRNFTSFSTSKINEIEQLLHMLP